MGQIKRKKVNLTPEEFNKLIDELRANKVKYVIKECGINVHCKTTRYDYCASLTGIVEYEPHPAAISREFHEKTGYHYLEEYITEQEKHPFGYTVIKINKEKDKIIWDYKTACGTSYVNEFYSRKPLKIWSYDVNSSFGYAMLKPMPDTRKEPRYNGIVNNGEIGFYIHGGATTCLGTPADIIFPLMDSPFKQYVYEYYKKKKEAPKDSVERIIAKYALNIPTGCIQRHNIFLRNAVLYYANQYIMKYIDENTVYCNVDSIYSLVPRPDIPVGDDIGQFKLEHECEDFKFIGVGMYQIGNECHYQGLSTILLGDIEHPEEAKDNKSRLKYKFNRNTERFELNEQK